MEVSKVNNIKLIVGLGNPGDKYTSTRHNIGFMSVEHLGGSCDSPSPVWQNKFKGLYTSIESSGQKIHLLKPLTYMNLSGESVVPLMQFFKYSPSEILVIHDELDLPLGKIMFKKGGGLAGHNGLKSIAACLGTQDFLRLRLGIDRPTKGEVINWVLGSFSGQEEVHLRTVLEETTTALKFCLKEGFDRAANKFNKADLIANK